MQLRSKKKENNEGKKKSFFVYSGDLIKFYMIQNQVKSPYQNYFKLIKKYR